jgi:hypothetical protein
MVNKPVIGVAVGVVAIAAGAWYFLHVRNAPLPSVASVPASAPVETPPAEEPVQHPVPPAAQPAATPLPTLSDSDVPLKSALSQLAGSSVADFLRPEALVRNIVVTVDNLPRQKLAVEKRPVVPPAGNFQVSGDELHATVDPKNYERYKPMVSAVTMLNMKDVAEVYFHYYPLFQQAYQNLGYPNGYFNDRLVQVIDVLLATPAPGNAALVRPNVMYTYADDALEQRPAGQKLLMRMGPENAAAIKAKLMELRAIVTAAPPK